MKTYLIIVHSQYLFNLLCLSSPIKCIIGLAEPPELWVPWTQRDISGGILSECECAIFIRSVNYLACGRHTASCYPLKCIIDKKKTKIKCKMLTYTLIVVNLCYSNIQPLSL